MTATVGSWPTVALSATRRFGPDAAMRHAQNRPSLCSRMAHPTDLGTHMAGKKRDLVIHYDEQLGKVIFYSADVESTAAIRAKEFGGVCPAVAVLREGSAEEAEMKLGRLVFSFIDLYSVEKIGIRDYEAEAAELHAADIAECEKQAQFGDSDAQHQLFMDLHSRAIKNGSLADLTRAETLLRASASQGHPGAILSLESWPVLKAAAERRIARRTAD